MGCCLLKVFINVRFNPITEKMTVRIYINLTDILYNLIVFITTTRFYVLKRGVEWPSTSPISMYMTIPRDTNIRHTDHTALQTNHIDTNDKNNIRCWLPNHTTVDFFSYVKKSKKENLNGVQFWGWQRCDSSIFYYHILYVIF